MVRCVDGAKQPKKKIGTFVIEKGTLSLSKSDLQLYHRFHSKSCVVVELIRVRVMDSLE